MDSLLNINSQIDLHAIVKEFPDYIECPRCFLNLRECFCFRILYSYVDQELTSRFLLGIVDNLNNEIDLQVKKEIFENKLARSKRQLDKLKEIREKYMTLFKNIDNFYKQLMLRCSNRIEHLEDIDAFLGDLENEAYFEEQSVHLSDLLIDKWNLHQYITDGQNKSE